MKREHRPYGPYEAYLKRPGKDRKIFKLYKFRTMTNKRDKKGKLRPDEMRQPGFGKKLVIIGASGHGKVVADIGVRNGYEEIVFLDDDETVKMCGRYSVIGKSGKIREIDGDVIVAIGNSAIRSRIQEEIEEERLTVLIHPDAVVAESAMVGKGTVIMAGVVVNPDSEIGKGCIINTCASVDHDCRIGDYVHVAVGTHLAGHVEIGEGTWIGAGTTVSNDIRICGGCVVGAGTVVVKDIEEPGTYVGVPAEPIKEEDK